MSGSGNGGSGGGGSAAAALPVLARLSYLAFFGVLLAWLGKLHWHGPADILPARQDGDATATASAPLPFLCSPPTPDARSLLARIGRGPAVDLSGGGDAGSGGVVG
jgi:hypothetical protein